jgi:hypothetical protein
VTIIAQQHFLYNYHPVGKNKRFSATSPENMKQVLQISLKSKKNRTAFISESQSCFADFGL